MFVSLLRMRETGYFMMAVFIGYILGGAAVLPAVIALYVMSAPVLWYVIAVTLILVPLSPFIFRYARVLWLHLDELLDPRADA